jgi:hypothetical protein
VDYRWDCRAAAGDCLLRAGALPRAGGIIRYPVFSHGELMGYLLGFITLIAFSSLISIEIVAARQYAAAWFPMLTQPGSSDPTLLGWVVQFLLLCFFFGLNYYSVKTFARSNNIISILKFLVPLAVVVTLFTFFKPENLHVQGFAPFGMSGVEAAISAGGLFCLPGADADYLCGKRSTEPTADNPGRVDFIGGVVDDYLRAAATGVSWQYPNRNAW